MSSHAEIMRAHRQDQWHPYYSLAGGHSSNHVPSKPINHPAKIYIASPKWQWGHFQSAIEQAARALGLR